MRTRPSLITSAAEAAAIPFYLCNCVLWSISMQLMLYINLSEWSHLLFVIWPSLFTPCRCVPWSISSPSSMQMMLCIYLFCFRGGTLTSSLVNGRWEGEMLTMFLLMDLVSLMLPPVVQKTWAKTFHIPGGAVRQAVEVQACKWKWWTWRNHQFRIWDNSEAREVEAEIKEAIVF